MGGFFIITEYFAIENTFDFFLCQNGEWWCLCLQILSFNKQFTLAIKNEILRGVAVANIFRFKFENIVNLPKNENALGLTPPKAHVHSLVGDKGRIC